MVEIKDIGYGTAIGILFIASILGFIPEDTETHFCEATNITMACDRLSGTELTCYPNAEDGKGYKRCSSLWKPIDRSDLVYAEQTVKLELKAGGVIECEVVDGFVGQDCYFNRREAFRSEFE